ncbi:uncharacterized protein LOC132559753 [Ylistrum balloti]|uniref:uncharacterized protein LOC132559753 n=1 Tax=Ylistrum balloti TaxID=509963 RepID=UPI002905955D|nr:uncharacterized protein LOC132559753 [Ylistrum balloti]
MEAFTKLGVMDIDLSPNEYKNDFFSMTSSSSLESGYESVRQTTNSTNSSLDHSTDFDSMSSEEQFPQTSDEACCVSDISNVRIEHTDESTKLRQIGNKCCKRKLTVTTKQVDRMEPAIEDHKSMPSPTKLMKTLPIQESCREQKPCSHDENRCDSIDTVEERAPSFDELDLPDGVRRLNCAYYDNIVREETRSERKCYQKRLPTTQTSQIKRKNSNKGWLQIDSQPDGHFISECSQEFPYFKSGDRLISVNETDTGNLHHQEVVRLLYNFIQMDTNQSMMIEIHRHHEEDDETFEILTFEVKIELLEEDGENGQSIGISTRLLARVFRSFRIIYNLEYNGKEKCWISHFTNSRKMYLCPKDGQSGSLTLENLPSFNEPKFQFTRCIYHGFRRQGHNNNGLYLITLVSEDTYKFISVGTKGNVQLKGNEEVGPHRTSITGPLPQMFISHPFKQRECDFYLESLNHEGWFLRWNTRETTMDIKRVEDVKNLRGGQSDLLFSIYTLSDLH